MAQKEFLKIIPFELQDKICLKRFKISLIKCNSKKEIDLARFILDKAAKEIFKEERLQTKEKATNYLKDTLLTFLLEYNNIDLNNIINKNKNKITLEEIMLDAIENEEKKFKEKFIYLEKIDIRNKSDNTLRAYKAIFKSLKRFFGNDYDVNDLNYKMVDEYASQFKNDTYINHLKSIFDRYISKNNLESKMTNWFRKLETSSRRKYTKINEDDKNEDGVIFNYDEILNILDSLDNEKKLIFKILLYTGMRLDELVSLAKKHIKKDCFYFYDAKGYFSKVVPVHTNLVDELNTNIKNKKLKDDDFVFFNELQFDRVNKIRQKFNSLKVFKKIGKTLHKTRATFISYVHFFCENFNYNDVRVLTHKLEGNDQNIYKKVENIERLRNVIDSIELEKLKIIEQQQKKE